MGKNFIQMIRGWLDDGRPASYNYSHPAMTVHCNRVHLQPPSPPNPPTPTPTPPSPTLSLSPSPTPPRTFISFSSSYSISSSSILFETNKNHSLTAKTNVTMNMAEW